MWSCFFSLLNNSHRFSDSSCRVLVSSLSPVCFASLAAHLHQNSRCPPPPVVCVAEELQMDHLQRLSVSTNTKHVCDFQASQQGGTPKKWLCVYHQRTPHGSRRATQTKAAVVPGPGTVFPQLQHKEGQSRKLKKKMLALPQVCTPVAHWTLRQAPLKPKSMKWTRLVEKSATATVPRHTTIITAPDTTTTSTAMPRRLTQSTHVKSKHHGPHRTFPHTDHHNTQHPTLQVTETSFHIIE
jgi:hypothetical protein